VRLGEGGTPLLPLPRLAQTLGVRELWLKDEAGNPTSSFKARGLALAVSGAVAFGQRGIALPSAGNAGSAAAAYAAAAGLACRITVPEDTPEVFTIEQRALGAEVRLVPGTIAEAGRALGSWAAPPAWWNVATFKEPFRLEGKKTLGYELAEQTDWRLPEVIFYPTGGGTGLVGMWKAFAEMRDLGWIDGPPPRLISVQAAGCAPVVRAFERQADETEPWPEAKTEAFGLTVPDPLGGFLALEAIRATSGTAVAVTDEELLASQRQAARSEGTWVCPEGAACFAAVARLRRDGWLASGDEVVVVNTGAGLKYPRTMPARPALLPADAAIPRGAESPMPEA